MARGLHTIDVTGTITSEPELRYTNSGFAILRIPIAGDDTIHDEEGKARTRPFYLNLKVLGNYAAALADGLHAGQPVYASARFDYNDYTDQNEQRHIGVELIANRIETLDESNIDVTHDARKQPRLLTAWNQATVIGNLTRDAELRHTPAGVAVTRLSVAVNDPPTRNNQRPKTHFLDVTLWGALAERYAGLPKGTGVVVRGRVNNDSYTDRSEVRQYTTRIEGIGVQVLTRPGDGQNTDNDRDDGAHAAAETHEQSDSVGVPPDDIF